MWPEEGANARAPEVYRGLIDGDELTAAYRHNARFDGRPNSINFITLDLGVPVPVDSIVFFPPQTGLTSDNQRQRDLFARAYEVSRTNVPVEWLIFEDENTSTDPLDTIHSMKLSAAHSPIIPALCLSLPSLPLRDFYALSLVKRPSRRCWQKSKSLVGAIPKKRAISPRRIHLEKPSA